MFALLAIIGKLSFWTTVKWAAKVAAASFAIKKAAEAIDAITKIGKTPTTAQIKRIEVLERKLIDTTEKARNVKKGKKNVWVDMDKLIEAPYTHEKVSL